MEPIDAMLSNVVYTYSPPGLTARGEPATAAGGASVSVSPAALAVIRSLIVDDDDRLPKSARATLARMHDREG
jgi:hypothetical protein